jgi:hypothetical protein
MTGEVPQKTDFDEERGLVERFRGSRLGRLIHRLNYERYEQHVPEPIRRMMEEAGAPPPTSYIPSEVDLPATIIPRSERP